MKNTRTGSFGIKTANNPPIPNKAPEAPTAYFDMSSLKTKDKKMKNNDATSPEIK